MAPHLFLALLGLTLAAPQTSDPVAESPPGVGQASETEPPVHFRVRVLQSVQAEKCDLGEQAVAINASGATAGRVCLGGRARAAYWTAAGKLERVDPSGAAEGPDSFAVDVDDEGTVLALVLEAAGPRSMLWSAGTSPIWMDLPPGATPLALGADRQVAFSYRPDNDPTRCFVGAILDEEGRPVDIASPGRDVLVRDVNAADVVTGIVGGSPGVARAFRWSRETGLVELDVPEGFAHAHGNAIDADGAVVGSSHDDEHEQATVWLPGEPPKLLPYVDDEHTHSAALGLNSRGWVVGYEHAKTADPERSRAVVWIDGIAWELDRLLLPYAENEIHVNVAWDVNETGQIAARCTLEGVQRALRLDPE